MLQWPRSPRSQPRNARFSSSVSSRSVFARRCSRETAMLVGVDHMRLDAARPQPPRQPEAVAAGLEGHRDADRSCGRPSPPPRASDAAATAASPRSASSFFGRMALDPRNDPGDQPARLAHLNDGDQRAILIQSGERSAQVIRLRHGAPPSVASSDDGAFPRRSPHSISARPRVGSFFERQVVGTEKPVHRAQSDGDPAPGRKRTADLPHGQIGLLGNQLPPRARCSPNRERRSPPSRAGTHGPRPASAAPSGGRC